MRGRRKKANIENTEAVEDDALLSPVLSQNAVDSDNNVDQGTVLYFGYLIL